MWSWLPFVLVHFWWKSIPEIRAGLAWILRVGHGRGCLTQERSVQKWFPGCQIEDLWSGTPTNLHLRAKQTKKLPFLSNSFFGLRTQTEPKSMCLLDPKTGASGSPVFPGHVRDPLRCFSGRPGKELRFEGCRSDVGLTVQEIWPFPWKLFFRVKVQNLTSEPPLYLYLYLCVRLCICICVFLFVFVYLYLYLVMTTFWVRFIFDENPLLRLRMALHEYLGSAPDTGT